MRRFIVAPDRTGERIEFADQAIAILFGRRGYMRNEGFDQVAASIFDRFGAAEVSGVGFDQIRIEFVLPNQEAELVAEPRRVGVMAIAVAPDRLGAIGGSRLDGLGRPAEFLDRAEADAVGFAERPIDGPGFGDAHFGAADKRRDVGGIGIAVSDEASRTAGLVNCRFEDPSVCSRLRELQHGFDINAVRTGDDWPIAISRYVSHTNHLLLS